MKKIICKKEYDTDTSVVVEKRSFGSFGDTDGYEEILYKTESGSFFLYVNGGADSKYPKEDIKRMSAKAAEEWIALGN